MCSRIAAWICRLDLETSVFRRADTSMITTGAIRIALADTSPASPLRWDTLPAVSIRNLLSSYHFSPKGYPLRFTTGLQACHVEVDVETGFTKILNVWVVEDADASSIQMLVDKQVRGGAVQGLGAAFFEECRYNDNGQLENGPLADYLVPMACEMPDIRIQHVETPTRDTELGARGCGRRDRGGVRGCTERVRDAIAPLGAVRTRESQ